LNDFFISLLGGGPKNGFAAAGRNAQQRPEQIVFACLVQHSLRLGQGRVRCYVYVVNSTGLTWLS